jgi:serpin B
VTEQDFDAARSLNSVGLDLLRQLAETRTTETIILSPYSIESALALAYAGAEGGTREEMARVLRMPAANGSLQRGFTSLSRAMDEMAARGNEIAAMRTRSGAPTDPFQWSVANRLFGQHDYGFRESFLTLMREGFEAPLESVDFRANTEFARNSINQWVEQQTRDKIKNLIPFGGVDVDTRLVVVNALYLKAPWNIPFDKSATALRPFRSGSNTVRDVPTMQRTGSLGYAKEDGMSVVSLDYIGGGLQFLVVLPDESESLANVSRRLTHDHFARWASLGAASPKRVELYLPKFRVEGVTVPLGTPLQALGMRQAFDMPSGSANFDGIAPREGNRPLAISNVFHQTFIALDEEGTEAAAATAVVIGTTSLIIEPPPIQVRVDRPFLFAIQHKASGACLFLGRLMDVP